jgi:hypothetical protein
VKCRCVEGEIAMCNKIGKVIRTRLIAEVADIRTEKFRILSSLVIEIVLIGLIIATIQIVRDLVNAYIDFVHIAIFVIFLALVPLSLNKYGTISKEKKLKNGFLHIAIIVSLLVVFGGISLVSSAVYPPTLPINFGALQNNETGTLTNATCDSPIGYEQPIQGQFLRCYASVTFSSEVNVTNYHITYDIIAYPSRNETRESPGYERVNFANMTYTFEGIRISIGNEELHDLRLEFEFSGPHTHILTNTYYATFTAVSLSDYNQHQNFNLTGLISVITEGLFSSVIAVKNLMNIWDRKDDGALKAKS